MRKTLLIAPLLAALAACSQSEPEAPASADPAAQPPAAPDSAPLAPTPTDPAAAADAGRTASATLAPTEGNEVRGTLQFEAVDGGIRITGEITGLPGAGEHGFHVHETGDCSAPDASSAGGHFNPASSAHGRVGHGEHHAGDSDNIVATAAGIAVVDRRLEGATLGDGAATDIVGKGVIVHAKPDDYTTQPTGDAGGRLACGVIEAGA
ncbi:superoxide dismutase family protein [Luteimonas huabeiensis]|uniref:superoxide dismutase family protein n=1 Tax=Luteimonas huabeiensis TaxID=1244513 RepID=UPI0004645823|nr:superoxide dismutase family protein [Luteimonas huabeiensis]